ncbi:hypothetical protein N8683_02385 [bacterium]|nr:hypothetical protein [bacterium]
MDYQKRIGFEAKNPQVEGVYGPGCVDLVKRGEGKKYQKLVKKDYESDFEDDHDHDDVKEPIDLGDMENYLSQKPKAIKVKGSCLITLIGISISFLTLVISLASYLFW